MGSLCGLALWRLGEPTAAEEALQVSLQKLGSKLLPFLLGPPSQLFLRATHLDWTQGHISRDTGLGGIIDDNADWNQDMRRVPLPPPQVSPPQAPKSPPSCSWEPSPTNAHRNQIRPPVPAAFPETDPAVPAIFSLLTVQVECVPPLCPHCRKLL